MYIIYICISYVYHIVYHIYIIHYMQIVYLRKRTSFVEPSREDALVYGQTVPTYGLISLMKFLLFIKTPFHKDLPRVFEI